MNSTARSIRTFLLLAGLFFATASTAVEIAAVEVTQQVDYSNLRWVLPGIALLLFSILLWSRSLQRQVAERKQAEQKSALFHRVLEQSLNEIYLFDKETLHYVDVNLGARKNIVYSMT